MTYVSKEYEINKNGTGAITTTKNSVFIGL